jgi:hypothetical protein
LPTWTWLVILGTHLATAFAQLVAGTELRSMGLRSLTRVRAFLWTAVAAAVVHIAVVTMASSGPFPWEGALWMLLELVTWPAAVALLLHRPAMRAWLARVAEGEVEVEDRNRSIEATGAIMVALGASGSVCAAFLLYEGVVGDSLPLVSSPEHRLWLVVAVAGFLGRSAVHLHAGILAMRGADPLEFARLVRRYVRAHWISVVLAGGVVVVAMIAASREEHRGFVMSLSHTPVKAMTAAMLLAVLGLVSLWPLLLRSRAQQLAGEDGGSDEGGSITFGRPADGGLVTLGWFLCAYAAGSLAPAVGAAVSGGYGQGIMQLGQLPGPIWFLDESLPSWFGLVGVGLAAWGGIELCLMTPRARVAAIAVAGIILVLALYTQLPHLQALGRPGGANDAFAHVFGVLAGQTLLLSFVFPVLVITMALRAPPK